MPSTSRPLASIIIPFAFPLFLLFSATFACHLRHIYLYDKQAQGSCNDSDRHRLRALTHLPTICLPHRFTTPQVCRAPPSPHRFGCFCRKMTNCAQILSHLCRTNLFRCFTNVAEYARVRSGQMALPELLFSMLQLHFRICSHTYA